MKAIVAVDGPNVTGVNANILGRNISEWERPKYKNYRAFTNWFVGQSKIPRTSMVRNLFLNIPDTLPYRAEQAMQADLNAVMVDGWLGFAKRKNGDYKSDIDQDLIAFVYDCIRIDNGSLSPQDLQRLEKKYGSWVKNQRPHELEQVVIVSGNVKDFGKLIENCCAAGFTTTLVCYTEFFKDVKGWHTNDRFHLQEIREICAKVGEEKVSFIPSPPPKLFDPQKVTAEGVTFGRTW